MLNPTLLANGSHPATSSRHNQAALSFPHLSPYTLLAPLTSSYSTCPCPQPTKFPPIAADTGPQFTLPQSKSQTTQFHFHPPQAPAYPGASSLTSCPQQSGAVQGLSHKPHLPPISLFTPCISGSSNSSATTTTATTTSASSNLPSPNYSNSSRTTCKNSSCSSCSSNCSSPNSSSSPFLSLDKKECLQSLHATGSVDYSHLTHFPAHPPHSHPHPPPQQQHQTARHLKPIDSASYGLFDRYSSDVYNPASAASAPNFTYTSVQPTLNYLALPTYPQLAQPQPQQALAAAPAAPLPSSPFIVSAPTSSALPLLPVPVQNSSSSLIAASSKPLTTLTYLHGNHNLDQAPLQAQAQPSTSSSRKQPNWAEFYKNGYPSEVIVISDDEDDHAHNPRAAGSLKRKLSLDDSSPPAKKPCSYIDYRPPLGPIVKAREVRVPVVFDQKPSTAPATLCDDGDGHLNVKNTTFLADGRFRVMKVLGQGTFGKVVSAYDYKTNEYCAIKIIRAVPKYRDASKIELRVLTTLAAYDPSNRNRCIHLRECFDYKNHICIVTDLLGMSIYDFLKFNRYVAFPAAHVQSFARQIFASVAYLHDLGLVHTDLKPENILLRDSTATTRSVRNHPKYTTRQELLDTDINLIDFGSAIFDDEYHNNVVSTRHYRAPEIIMGVGWSFPCDIWSIGCILVEFCTGEALFQTHDNLEHLALMQRVIGKPVDRSMLRDASYSSGGSAGPDLVLTTASGGLQINYPNPQTRKASEKHVKSTRALTQVIRSVMPVMDDADPVYWKSFLDLLSRIFVYDPRQRITAREALQHPWLAMNVHGSH